jgi:hypothetical protein
LSCLTSAQSAAELWAFAVFWTLQGTSFHQQIDEQVSVFRAFPASVETWNVLLSQQSDTESDTRKDRKKKRLLSEDGRLCAVYIKRLRTQNDYETKEAAIRQWISEQPCPDALSYVSIDRELSDNPKYWK